MAVIFPPDKMMIIEDDGSDKHERMFTLKSGKVEWWKPNRWARANKGPFVLRAVERYGKSEAGLLRLVTSNGVDRIVRPRDDEMRERWLTARLSDGGSDGPSDTEELRLRTRFHVQRKPHVPAPRRLKPPPRSPSGSLGDDARSDPGSDVSDPSLLSTPSRADSELESLKYENNLRRREAEHHRLELECSAIQGEVGRCDQEMLRTPRLTPHRLTSMYQRPSNCVVRRTTRDFDLAVGQRVQYLSIDQGRWVRATVTRLNSDYSVNLDGDDGIIRRNYHVFRHGRRVIR